MPRAKDQGYIPALNTLETSIGPWKVSGTKHGGLLPLPYRLAFDDGLRCWDSRSLPPLEGACMMQKSRLPMARFACLWLTWVAILVMPCKLPAQSLPPTQQEQQTAPNQEEPTAPAAGPQETAKAAPAPAKHL